MLEGIVGGSVIATYARTRRRTLRPHHPNATTHGAASSLDWRAIGRRALGLPHPPRDSEPIIAPAKDEPATIPAGIRAALDAVPMKPRSRIILCVCVGHFAGKSLPVTPYDFAPGAGLMVYADTAHPDPWFRMGAPYTISRPK